VRPLAYPRIGASVRLGRGIGRGSADARPSYCRCYEVFWLNRVTWIAYSIKLRFERCISLTT
jgi:hypothetical protein